MELFNWHDLGYEAVGIGRYNPKSEKTELKSRSDGTYQRDLERRREAYKAKREAIGKRVTNYAR